MSATLLGALALGCAGPQSALDAASGEALRIERLFWGMVIGSLAIWALVVGIAIYAAHAPPPATLRAQRWLIVGGGVVLPTLTLAGLLAYGLWLLPAHLAPAPPNSLRIRVSGEQWWWRVRYLPPGGAPVDLANELWLPLGEPVELELESPDVIHSLWIGPLGGKMDMIPGRTTRWRVQPTRAGTFRGVCAEYCGESHALMALPVVVRPRAEFDAWLRAQAAPASEPVEPAAVQGHTLFVANGCGACHAVRGTTADGAVGPDLTHVGSRRSLGAGTLGTDPSDFSRWLAHTDVLKPGVHMPAFRMLPPAELDQLGAYLRSLR